MLCYCCHGLFFLCNYIIIVVDAAEPLLLTNFKGEKFLQIHFLCSLENALLSKQRVKNTERHLLWPLIYVLYISSQWCILHFCFGLNLYCIWNLKFCPWSTHCKYMSAWKKKKKCVKFLIVFIRYSRVDGSKPHSSFAPVQLLVPFFTPLNSGRRRRRRCSVYSFVELQLNSLRAFSFFKEIKQVILGFFFLNALTRLWVYLQRSSSNVQVWTMHENQQSGKVVSKPKDTFQHWRFRKDILFPSCSQAVI